MNTKTIEIERKFLVDPTKLPGDLFLNAETMWILQGYLSETPVVRVRMSNNKGFITVKGPQTNFQRNEWEYEIPTQHVEKMLDLCATKLLKMRTKVEYMGKIWEVDEFKGALEGLWIAEVELDSNTEEFSIPPWVGEEVSTDFRYTNASLAKSQKIP